MHKEGLRSKLVSILKSEATAKIAPLAIVVIFAIIGISLIAASHAATSAAVLEAENGALAGNQGPGLATGASGSSVKFGANATAPSPTPSPTPTPAPGTSAQPTGSIPGPWTLTFNDDFNGTTLDTTKWSNRPDRAPNNESSEYACYGPSAVSVSNGSLNLTTNQRSCLSYQYTTGQIDTDPMFKQLYGYFEARIFLPGTGGRTNNWAAFWILPYISTNICWPTGGELDIMETNGGGANSHYGWGPACDQTTFPWPELDPAGGDWTGWHTFGADWEPGKYTIYYDGKSIGSYTSHVSTDAASMILDNAMAPNGGPKVAPSTMMVDYARAWKKQ